MVSHFLLLSCLPLFCATSACATASVVPEEVSSRVAQDTVEGQQRAPHGGMLRYPDISDEHIVFSYGDDLWVVADEGGVATPLASPVGLERNPRFSPDGERIAFVGNYDGNTDLYTVDVAGGVPFRVTHHPTRELLTDWTAQDELLYHTRGTAGSSRQNMLFTVSPAGGLPTQLPVPFGSWGALSPDGKRIAYSPTSRVGRSWKRYQGGLASDLWLLDLASGDARALTSFAGTDVMPMWRGESIYFLSDAGENHRLNLWVIGADGSGLRQVTNYDADVQWPAIGGDRIVFVVGDSMRVLDLASEADRIVEVRVPGAKPLLREQWVDASEFIENYTISPSAKRLGLEARGDLWTVPAKKGTPRNLTRSSGVFEREPEWSPDGRWIAFMSDETGEYELYVIQSDGKGERRRVTTNAAPFRYALTWSPDSKWICYVLKGGYLELVNVETGEITRIDQDPFAQYSETLDANWSHDSAWIAYTKGQPGSISSSSIYLYELATKTSTQVTSDYFPQHEPCFDRAGDYLYYIGRGSFTPEYSELDSTWIYTKSDVLHIVPLRADMASPFAPMSDEEAWGDDDEQDAVSEDDDKAEGAEVAGDAGPLKVDFKGFEARSIRLPIAAGKFRSLAVNDGGALLYMRRKADDSPIMLFDVAADDPEEKVVIADVDGFGLTAKGDQLIYLKGSNVYIAPATADAKGEQISTSGLSVMIDPRAEWAQILRDAWRLQRDFFYVENMHGVDWDGVYTKYSALLEDATSRRDLGFLIGEMIAELNVGHAYSRGGDVENPMERNTGLLGVDFSLENGAYRIATIYQGGVWDSDARGPLSQPGVDVNEGDYLLAVNGVALDVSQDPWAAFGGLAGKIITLTVSAKPVMDDEAREVVVEALSSERNLRYRSWIEGTRRYVEEKSGGKVGYIYVPSTGRDGQSDLVRQFFPQLDKQALIIDDRWNGGGQIPTRFIELLNRPVVNYWARRDGTDWTWPNDGHHGPKCMLINGAAGSGGDAFPAYFRAMDLGKLIGTRTWGGLVGISGNPGLIDGAFMSVPTFGYYDKDGTWAIEGHGVDPDIEVIADPTLMKDGADPQVDAAIELMLREIEAKGYQAPKRPAAPDRSGMGIAEEDR